MELTQQTKDLAARLFAPEYREPVLEILLTRCGDNLPNIGPITPTNTNIERVLYGALKLSAGDFPKFQRIVAMDWRDILVFSGFGNSLTVHRQWADELLQRSDG